jgi:SAM-dependent methyltransferase
MEAAEEYFSRHRHTAARRRASRRESRLVARLLASLPGSNGALLLDAACGTGRTSATLVERGRNVLSIDVSWDMLHKGIETDNIAPGKAVVGSIFHLPFGDKTFSGGVCIRFMHHLPESYQRLAALKELCRVVRGSIVISLWTRFNIQHVRRRIKRLLGRRPSTRHTMPLAQMKKEVKSAGLRMKRVRFLYPFISETVYLLIHPEETGTGERG